MQRKNAFYFHYHYFRPLHEACGIQDRSSPSRDQTWTPCSQSGVLTTGPPRNSQEGFSKKFYFIQEFVVVQSPKARPTLCDPMDCSMPGFPVLHHLPEFVQTQVH